jgi:NAD(P)-dependent dehydrogenase (short-subunit alcohol dehydrogenase family)
MATASQLQKPQRVALVTGSASGIGFATAKLLLEAGYLVQLHGEQDRKDLAVEVQSFLDANSEATSYQSVDFSNPELGSSELVSKSLERFGRIDDLVLSAGVAYHQEISEVTLSAWQEVLSVNLLAPFFLVQQLEAELGRSKGVVVVVSSTNANRVNHKNTLYDVSKAALNHLARSLALELKPLGVRVNVVMPGATQTPMLQSWLEKFSEDPIGTFNQVKASGDLAQPEDVAKVIRLLLNQDGAWVTGAAIEVDGGAHLGEYWR